MEAQLSKVIKAQGVPQPQLVSSSAAFDMEDVQKNLAVLGALFRSIVAAKGSYAALAVSVFTRAVVQAYGSQVDAGASRLLEFWLSGV